MNPYVVWLDSEHAKIFKLLPGGKSEQEVLKSGVRKDHHTGPSNQGSAHHQAEEHFLHDLAGKLKPAVEVLVVGPGIAKSHFKHHLEKHHHSDLLKKVVAFENMDHPTDGQIVDMAHKFFKKYDIFAK